MLTGGRKCTIFQLQDDHSRLAVASHVANGENSESALWVVKKGIAAHGVPQRLLTDNGMALNPARRGLQGQLVSYVTSLGVEAITGKPYKPTTQGKNERFHQTLFRWLDKQPLASTIAELQAQVDAFDVIYNTQRPHQGLPGRMTPQQAWDATPVAEPPRPKPRPKAITLPERAAIPGHRETKIYPAGYVYIHGIKFQISSLRAGQEVHVVWDQDSLVFADLDGEVLIEHPRPEPGTKYVSNGVPRGPKPKNRDQQGESPMS